MFSFGTDDRIEKYTLNASGGVLVVERSFDGSTWEETQTNTLNLRGQVEGYTLERTSANMQDVAVSRILDVYGRVTYASYDSKMDGSINRAEKYYYDANGLLIKKEVDGDGGDTFEVSYTEYYSYDAQNNLIAKGIDWDGDGQVDTLEKHVLDSLGRVIETHQFKDGNDKAEDGVSERQADAIIYNIIDSVTGYVMERREDLDGQGSSNTDSIDKTTVYVRDIDGRNLQESQFLDGDTSNNDGKADKVVYHRYDDSGYRIGQSEDNNGDGKIDTIRNFVITAGGHIISINDYNDGDAENDNGKIDRIEERFLDDRGWYDYVNYYSTTEDGKKDQLTSAYSKIEIADKALSAASGNWSRVEHDSDGNGIVDTITLRTAFAADNQPTRTEVYTKVEETGTEFLDAEGTQKRTPDRITETQYDLYGNMSAQLVDTGSDGKVNQILIYERDTYGRVSRQESYSGTNLVLKDGKVFEQTQAEGSQEVTLTQVYAGSIWEVLERDVYGTTVKRKNIIDNVDGVTDGTADKVIIQEYATDDKGVALGQITDGNSIAPNDTYLVKQLTFNSGIESATADQTVTWNRTEEGKVLERYQDDKSDGTYENVQINRYDDEGNQLTYTLYQTTTSYTLPAGAKLGTGENADILVTSDDQAITPYLVRKYSNGLVVEDHYDSNYNGYVNDVRLYTYNDAGQRLRQESYSGTNLVLKDGKVFEQTQAEGSQEVTLTQVYAGSIWEVLERDVYGTTVKRKNIIDNVDGVTDGTADKVIIQEYATDDKGVALGQITDGNSIAPNDTYLVKQLTFNSGIESATADQTVTWNRTEEGKVLERYQDDKSDGTYENVQINRYDDEGNQLTYTLYQTTTSYTLPAGAKLGTGENADILVTSDDQAITPYLVRKYSNGLVVEDHYDSNYNGYVNDVRLYTYNDAGQRLYYMNDITSASGRNDTTDPATGNKISHIMFQAVNQTLDLTEWADNAEMIQKFAATGLRELLLDNTATTNIELVLSKEILAQIAKTNVQITQADTGDTLKLSGYTESDKTVAGDGIQMFKFTSDLSSSEYTLYVDKDVEISYI